MIPNRSIAQQSDSRLQSPG